MSNSDETPPDRDPRLTNLDRKVGEAVARQEAEDAAARARAGSAGSSAGYSAAWRIVIDLVVSVLAVGGLGLLIDRWLATAPFVMLAGLFIGFAIGMYLAVRTGRRMQSPAPQDRS